MNPERFGSFRIIGEMGPGRFGPVFCAQDTVSGQVVVIRTVTQPLREAERGAVLRALTELCAAPLDHASIARPITTGLADETPYLVHSYLPGKALDEVWQRIGPQPLADVLARLTRVAAALDCAAAAGVHHGLLAPRDIIFDTADAGITGLGLAQALARTQLHISLPQSYASPQRLAGWPPTLADDVHAFAGIVFHLLVGEAPRREALSQQVTNVQWALPDELLAAIEPALSLEPERRPESALAFIGRLQEVVTFASERVADIEATPEPPEPVITRTSLVVHASSDGELLLNDHTDPPRWGIDESPGPVFTIVPAEAPRADIPAPGMPASRRFRGDTFSGITARKQSVTLPLVLGGAAALALLGIFGLGYQLGHRQTSPPRRSNPVATAAQDRTPAAVAEATTGQNPPGPPADQPSAPGSEVASERLAPVAPGPPSSRDSGVASARTADAARSAGLLIHSTPVGARVTVDDQPRGITPLVLRGLAFGEHRVALALPGYYPQQQQVSLTTERAAQSLEFELRSASVAANPPAGGVDGALQVDSRPGTAQVYLDDALVGSTPLLLPNVTAGSHTIRLELAGYQHWTTSVAVEPGMRTRVAASLDR